MLRGQGDRVLQLAMLHGEAAAAAAVGGPGGALEQLLLLLLHALLLLLQLSLRGLAVVVVVVTAAAKPCAPAAMHRRRRRSGGSGSGGRGHEHVRVRACMLRRSADRQLHQQVSGRQRAVRPRPCSCSSSMLRSSMLGSRVVVHGRPRMVAVVAPKRALPLRL